MTNDDETRMHSEAADGKGTVRREPVPQPGGEATVPDDTGKGSPEAASGPHIPGYTTVRRVGSGGFSTVYQARDSRGRDVAIKVLKREFAGSAEVVERFRRAARLLESFDHPNIVRVFDIVSVDGRPGLVMEFVQGETLSKVLREKGKLSVEEAIEIASQMCDALIYAHGRGVIHRDVKPSNILLTSPGKGDEDEVVAKLTDFDIAKIMTSAEVTRSGIQMGTPYYVAPEQWKGKSDIDERADVFSLGIVLYQMLTGEIPAGRFGHPSDTSPGIPRRLGSVILKAIASSRDARYPSMEEFKRALVGDRETKATQDVPFEFYPGRFASSLAELVDLCDKDWDAGLTHLKKGNILIWLNRVKPALEPCVRKVTEGKTDWNEALEEALHCLDHTLPRPVLETRPVSLDFGKLAPGESRITSLTIHNPSRGYLVGRVKEKPDWLGAVPERFHCLAGESVEVSATAMVQKDASPRALSGEMKMESNGGDVAVPVSMEVARRLLIERTYSVGSIEELCNTAPKNWRQVRELMYNGELAKWLRHGVLLTALANRAEEIVLDEGADRDEGLFQFLNEARKTPYEGCTDLDKILPPRLSVSKSEVPLNNAAGKLVPARVTVVNKGGGDLREMRVRAPAWVKVEVARSREKKRVVVTLRGDRNKAGVGVSRGEVVFSIPRGIVPKWQATKVAVEMNVSLIDTLISYFNEGGWKLLLAALALLVLLVSAGILLVGALGWKWVLLGIFALLAGSGLALTMYMYLFE